MGKPVGYLALPSWEIAEVRVEISDAESLVQRASVLSTPAAIPPSSSSSSSSFSSSSPYSPVSSSPPWSSPPLSPGGKRRAGVRERTSFQSSVDPAMELAASKRLNEVFQQQLAEMELVLELRHVSVKGDCCWLILVPGLSARGLMCCEACTRALRDNFAMRAVCRYFRSSHSASIFREHAS